MFFVKPIGWLWCSSEDEVDVVFGFDAAWAVCPDDAGDDVEEGLAFSAPGRCQVGLTGNAGNHRRSKARMHRGLRNRRFGTPVSHSVISPGRSQLLGCLRAEARQGGRCCGLCRRGGAQVACHGLAGNLD